MEQEGEGRLWHRDTMRVFRNTSVRQVAHVPDAGLSGLIRACDADPDIETTSLTTEEEGVALMAGAWLGGDRGCLLMQSSGVGNAINMLSVRETCRFPLVMIVTMRGEWAEFNPWQIPMGRAAETVLRAAGMDVRRPDREEDIGPTVEGAIALAYGSDLGVAVMVSQRLIGAKSW